MKKIFLVIAASWVMSASGAIAQEAIETTPGVLAAQEWLALADAGDSVRSWEATSEYFRNFVSQDQWTESLNAFREPLNVLISRTLVRVIPTPVLPGVPDGEYEVLKYNSVFGHKASAVETVTVKKDPDGVWRVIGYYIK
jgi:hypothetical protein